MFALCVGLPIAAVAKDASSYVTDEIFVRFEDNATATEIQGVIGEYQLTEKRRFAIVKAILYTLPKGVDAVEVKPKLHALPSVRYADLNNKGWVPTEYVSNEPKFVEQWYLHNEGQEVNAMKGSVNADIDWPEAMELYEPQGDGIVVAVIDTGLALDHPEFKTRWAGMRLEQSGVGINNFDDDGFGYIDDFVGWDFVDWDNDPTDLRGHGTMVAGLIAGDPDNGIGITGVAPHASIVPLRVFRETGGATDEDIILAAAYAIEAGARIINLSLGKGKPFNYPLQEAIYNLETEYDTLLICAAGNGGEDGVGDNLDLTPIYPAAYAGNAILSVAATDHDNNLAPFSNYGTISVDLAAPGKNILSPSVSRKIIYYEDFESTGSILWADTGGWWSQQNLYGNQSPYEWRSFTDQYGKKWVTDSDYNSYNELLDYVPHTNSAILSPSYDLAGVSAPQLKTTVYHDLPFNYFLRSYDYLLFEVSVDGGGTWNAIGHTYGKTYYPGTVYTFDLSEYEGALIKIRFGLLSDGLLQGDGVYVDNLLITGVSPFNYTGEEYEYDSGTSFAAPIVSGVAALILSQRPDLSALDAREILMQSVTKVDGLDGKIVSGGVVNAAEALRLANDWKRYDVTVTAGAGGTATGGGTYTEGSTATIAATPSSGYTFRNWSGVASESTNPLTITVTADMAITANFSQNAGGESEVSQNSWNLATNHGNGWKSFDWFGYYYDTGSNWICHSNLGWLYRVSDTLNSIWLWDASLGGWLWTKGEIYPFLYSSSRKDWLYYAKDTSPRYFWDFSTSEWITQ